MQKSRFVFSPHNTQNILEYFIDWFACFAGSFHRISMRFKLCYLANVLAISTHWIKAHKIVTYVISAIK